MAKIQLHAGDWGIGRGEFAMSGGFLLPIPGKIFEKETVRFSELSGIEAATEESVKRIGGTIGWGAAGAILLGPVGLLAGLLGGGRGKDVTFVATFKDGRKLMGTTDSKTFVKLKALVF